MNKNIFKLAVIAVLLIIATVNVNAQWFLGGGIGLNVNSEKYDGSSVTDGHSTMGSGTGIGFIIAPMGGYYFNEKFALGLRVRVGCDFSKSQTENESEYFEYAVNKTLYNSVNWGIYPLIQYSVFTYKKFSILLNGFTGVGCTHTFLKNTSTVGGDIENKNVRNTISIVVFNVRPTFCFKFNDHLQMEADLHFLNVGYSINILKIEGKEIGREMPNPYDNPYKSNGTYHNFDIGFSSSNILSLSQLTVGVIYKF